LTPSSSARTERVFLVIAAGGQGLRMGGGTPKQFRDWGGVPLLQATVRAFLGPEMPALAGIVLAVPADRLEQVRSWRFDPAAVAGGRMGLDPAPLIAVAGGPSRQDSVALALAALPGDPLAKVMIHDAVRPFPPPGPIRAALAALDGDAWAGAVLGEPSTDTLKRVGPDGLILGTEPREGIFRAQTPQVARLGAWREAFAWALANGFQGTDDVSLLEALGRRVRLIPSPATNLKITTVEDWARSRGPQGVVD
jgi:2-C-methyl-D-erythritol 4-phosphate cytidylyltransferase